MLWLVTISLCNYNHAMVCFTFNNLKTKINETGSYLILPPPGLTQSPSVLVYIQIHVAKSQIIVKWTLLLILQQWECLHSPQHTVMPSVTKLNSVSDFLKTLVGSCSSKTNAHLSFKLLYKLNLEEMLYFREWNDQYTYSCYGKSERTHLYHTFTQEFRNIDIYWQLLKVTEPNHLLYV